MILHPVDVVRDGNLAATGLRRAEQLCVVVALISVLMLCAYPNWLIDVRGQVAATDFVGEWAAGQLAVEGHPAAAYDWTVHKRAEINALGHEFDGDFPWCYPPPFLFVVAALARLPYLAAFAVWMAVTWVAFGIVLRGIIGHRFGFLLAAAFPATMFNIAVGQNGFLTAALIGGSLLLLDRRPMVAGLFLGMLTYKPHLGLVFPLALAVGGYWRTFASAAAVAMAFALASWAAFGSAAWAAFFQATATIAKVVLSDGAGLGRLQSTFGLVRTLGGGETTAWVFHIIVAFGSTAGVLIIWRRPVPFELKAAALTVGTVLITPYVYISDLTILALPIAFLTRLGLRTNFWTGEPAALIAAAACIFLFPEVGVVTGLLAMLVIAALILRRVCVGERMP